MFAPKTNYFTVARYAIKLARSTGFFNPENPILVPAAYFLGFSKNPSRFSGDQVSATATRAPE